jgi:NAD(P)-dependent dehydrogenase (short-subunit alcohol dehydrogenase family)
VRESGTLTGRVAVVTGGEAGIGRALASGLAAAGATVGVIGPGAEAAAPVDGVAATASSSLATREEVAAAFDRIDSALGPVDLLVHAYSDPSAFVRQPIQDVDDATWDARCEAGIRSALFALQAAHGRMRDRGGRIVLLAGTVGQSGAQGLVPYSASVEGQRALAKSAARQWGRVGITVNIVCPAMDHLGGEAISLTHHVPALGGAGDPERDIAPVIAFLVSDAAGFVTGNTLRLDGGDWMAG